MQSPGLLHQGEPICAHTAALFLPIPNVFSRAVFTAIANPGKNRLFYGRYS